MPVGLQPGYGRENTNMKSQLAEEIFELIEARSHPRPGPIEFEMAYQARVAIDRIRFAIKHTEQFERASCVRRNFSSSMLWSG
jgi:hypothetical protein